MKIIGVTGGVGAGKSTVLGLLQSICNCEIIMADDVAKSIMVKGGPLSKDAVRIFGDNAFLPDGSINRTVLAEKIFNNSGIRKEWENLVHPATNRRILELLDKAKSDGKEYAFVEAALLIENKYEEICDEIWYVYANEDVRRERLKSDRGYSDEKISGIYDSQMSDTEFRKHCDYVIDTGVSITHTKEQLINKMYGGKYGRNS